jgi:hypothetical protein
MATRQDFTSGQVLTAAELDAVATAMIAINAQTGTTYTTVLADDGKLVTCDNAASIALTIPPNSAVWPTASAHRSTLLNLVQAQ